MTLPSKEQLTGTNVTEQGFKIAQNQLIDHIDKEIATKKYAEQGAEKALNNSKDYVQTFVGGYHVNNKIIPLVVDAQGKIAVWLTNGKLDIAGVGSSFLHAFDNQQDSRVGISRNYIYQPIVIDKNGKSPLWLEYGKLNFAGISQSAVDKIAELLNISPTTEVKIATDGRTLTEWRAKSAKLKTGIQTQLSIAITGDSWTEYTLIPAALAPMLRNDYGIVGTGWINIGSWQNQIDDVSVTKTGTWSVFDISATTAQPQYGC